MRTSGEANLNRRIKAARVRSGEAEGDNLRCRCVALFAGAVLLASSIASGAGPGEEGGTTLRGLAIQAGRMLGAASGCPNIARARVDGIAAKIIGLIKPPAAGGDESAAAILDLLAKSEAEGARSLAAKEIDCAAAERQLADLESISTPAPQGEPSARGPSQPAVFAGQAVAAAVRGVTNNEIRFGAAVPLSGPNKNYGQEIRVGIETVFHAVNDAGGVHGRMLRLSLADDGYEPARTVEAVKHLYEHDQIFGFFGNFGTATAAVSLPFALEHRMLFFAGYTGAPVLRRDPPDRYVFNYRPSYAEETEAAVHYLVKLRRIRPEQIAVFAQQDGFGESGFEGVAKAMRTLRGSEGFILRLGYQRNSIDVEPAVAQLRANKTPIKAVVMVATYRAAAQFIEKTRDGYPGLLYTNPSVVGANSLRDELMLLGPKYAAGIVVTQAVPDVAGYSSLVLEYKSALAKYFGGEAADATSLEYYVAAKLLVEALNRAGRQPDTEKVVTELESIHGLDLGLGVPISFGKSEHQGLHKVWGTQLNESGKYEPIDLQ
jgi:branched-chain amino acid transport system substrate-binding protein